MSTRYSQGRAWEYRVKKELEREGWYVCRSAGSKGVADLCALMQGRAPMLVSCRLHGKITRAQRHTFAAAGKKAGAATRFAYRGEDGSIIMEPVW